MRPQGCLLSHEAPKAPTGSSGLDRAQAGYHGVPWPGEHGSYGIGPLPAVADEEARRPAGRLRSETPPVGRVPDGKHGVGRVNRSVLALAGPEPVRSGRVGIGALATRPSRVARSAGPRDHRPGPPGTSPGQPSNATAERTPLTGQSAIALCPGGAGRGAHPRRGPRPSVQCPWHPEPGAPACFWEKAKTGRTDRSAAGRSRERSPRNHRRV